LGINAQRWLENPKVQGDEELGGAKTTHITSDVRLPALFDDIDQLLQRADALGLSQSQRQQLPKRLDPKTRAALAKAVKTARVDIWTGKDDKILRQLKVHVEFKSPNGIGSQAQTQDIRSGTIDLTLAV